jgi:hypothetical protein
MWDPRRLTTLYASTACYRESFLYFSFSCICHTISNGSIVLSSEMGRVRKNFHGLFFKLRYSSSNLMEETRKIAESIAQNSQELHLEPLKYKRVVSILQPRFLQLLAVCLAPR